MSATTSRFTIRIPGGRWVIPGITARAVRALPFRTGSGIPGTGSDIGIRPIPSVSFRPSIFIATAGINAAITGFVILIVGSMRCGTPIRAVMPGAARCWRVTGSGAATA